MILLVWSTNNNSKKSWEHHHLNKFSEKVGNGPQSDFWIYMKGVAPNSSFLCAMYQHYGQNILKSHHFYKINANVGLVSL